MFKKILLSFLTVAFLPFLFTTIFLYSQVQKSSYKIIKQDRSNLIDELKIITEQHISDGVKHIQLLADSQIMRADDISFEDKAKEMRKIYDLFKVFDDITLLNSHGVVLASIRYDFRGDWKHKTWFKTALSGKLGISPVHVITDPTRFVNIVMAPVFDNNGEVETVIAGRIGLERVWKITDKIKVGSTGYAFITDINGKLLSFPDKSKILTKISPERLKTELLANNSGIIEFNDEANVPKICFYSTFNGDEQYLTDKWRIGIIQDKTDVYDLVYKMGRQITLIATMCFFIILILAFILSNKVVNPIKSLVRASEEVARGNLKNKVVITSKDEIGDLGRAFNKMVSDLKRTTVSIDVLEREQKRFQDVAMNTGDWIWEVDAFGKYTYSSPVVEQILGYNTQEVIGKFFYDFFPKERRKEMKEEAFKIINKKTPFKNYIKLNVSKNGKDVIIESSGVTIVDTDGKLLGYRGVDRDITEREQAKKALQETNDYLDNLFNYANAPIIVWDPDFKITRFNRAFEHLTGRKAADVIGKSLSILFPSNLTESSMELIRKTLCGERWEAVEFKILHLDGKIRTVLWNSATIFSPENNSPIATIAQGQDITEREQAEQELRVAYEKIKETKSQLVQSVKLASIGELAGGVAHEINNPLTGVLNNVQLIRVIAESKSEFNLNDFKELLSIIEESAIRCRSITQSLLDFSRASTGEFKLVSWNDITNKVTILIEHELKLKNIIVHKDLQPDLPWILGDHQLLQQVLFDIINNAAWAIRKKTSQEDGHIIIKTRNFPEERKVSIFISDSGCGIPEENLGKIFEPFFTTKDVGEGTGLGLSISYGIINAHKGKIEVESEEGKGTTFKISLPVISNEDTKFKGNII